MSWIHQIMAEVNRCKGTRGDPVCIRLNPLTKHEFESEMRARASFTNAYTSKTAGDMIINRLHEIDDKGRPIPGGWEIPIEPDNAVPKGQIWLGVDGYEISRQKIGRKIPHRFLQFPGRD